MVTVERELPGEVIGCVEPDDLDEPRFVAALQAKIREQEVRANGHGIRIPLEPPIGCRSCKCASEGRFDLVLAYLLRRGRKDRIAALQTEAAVQPSAKFPDPQQQTLAAAQYDSSDDAALLAAVTRAMQGPPVALQPAALLAQELLSAQITTAPDTRSTGSKGEIQ